MKESRVMQLCSCTMPWFTSISAAGFKHHLMHLLQETWTQKYQKAVDRRRHFAISPTPKGNLGSRKRVRKPHIHLQLWITFFICKAPRRCLLPKKVKVRNFHKPKGKGYLWSSCKISWSKCNGYKQAESLFEVSYKSRKEKPHHHAPTPNTY